MRLLARRSFFVYRMKSAELKPRPATERFFNMMIKCRLGIMRVRTPGYGTSNLHIQRRIIRHMLLYIYIWYNIISQIISGV